MAAEEGDCVVQIVSALTDESLCAPELPSSGTVLDVKRRVQAAWGVNVFRQRLLLWPAGPEVEDHQVLATLPGLRLQLVRLQCPDADADGIRHFLHAAGEGAAPEVERVLRLPLQPDCSQGPERHTPLILASDNGHPEVVRLLCEAGADKDKTGDRGATPLMRASDNGHLEVVRLLCEAGADKDKTDENGVTPLILASLHGQLEVVRLLSGAGADKDKANRYGVTPLILASESGHLEWHGCSARPGPTRTRRTLMVSRP